MKNKKAERQMIFDEIWKSITAIDIETEWIITKLRELEAQNDKV